MAIVAKKVSLLIIGAGPFGLAMAAYARHLGIDHIVVGKPMDFWKHNMPKGMLLRSPCSWHLDPLCVHTIDGYLETLHLTPADVEPLSMDCYLKYAEWFRNEKEIEPWLWPRINQDGVHVWPETEVKSCEERE